MPPTLSLAAAAEAQNAARRALALDPQVGEAWQALGALAANRRDYAKAEALFQAGLAGEPDHRSLPNFLGEVMGDVGRQEEALVFKRRALARDPGSPVKLADVALALARLGEMRAALDLLDRADQERGPSALLLRTRIEVLLRCGQPAMVITLLLPEIARPRLLEPEVSARLVGEARAMLDPAGAQAASLLRALPPNLADSPSNATLSMVTLARLGRRREASQIALRYLVNPAELFGPRQDWLVSGPEFPAIARRQGLWRYWVQTGRWPDACRNLGLAWRCRADG